MVMAVGIDPSLTATGIAFPSGRTRLIGTPGVTTMSWIQRHAVIETMVLEIITEVMGSDDGRPDLVVIEQLDMTQAYGGTIERTVLWWKVVELLARRGVRVETAASSIGKMYATGNGNAKKPEVILAVSRQWPQFDLKRANDNVADASAFCALGMHILGVPLTTVNAQQLRAVTRTKGLDHKPEKGKRAT
jgi:Holliday junction resolvasome RuvABC endonuclease subunit